jgi:hydrogenase maturation protein HypF
MAPSLEWVKRHTLISQEEATLLTSGEAPIVLLKKKSAGYLDWVSPNSKLGVLLPYTPLHYLLLNDFKGPLIATSGNRGDESLCIKNEEALKTLNGLADFFLVHDRTIVRALEDSLVKVVAGRPLFIRRARGFAPTYLKGNGDSEMLALGGDLKNAVTINLNGQSVIGSYQGDVDAVKNFNHHLEETRSLLEIKRCKPGELLCDAHPGYQTRRSAETFGVRIRDIQHHLAHLCSVVGEHQLDGPVLGMIFDGTGYGLDRNIWGGEWIHLTGQSQPVQKIYQDLSVNPLGGGKAKRVGHLRPFYLEGGEAAIKNPQRIANALLDPDKKRRGPLCSSMGRLFDGVSALIGFAGSVSFEGEAAIQLEEWATAATTESYPFTEKKGVIDWAPMISAITDDKTKGISKEIIATKFHNTVIAMMLTMAKKVNCEQIVLNGGCFQNDFLLERSVGQLRQQGFKVYWPQQLPVNDGGLSFGQLWASDVRFIQR